jgi:hypothetical protein
MPFDLYRLLPHFLYEPYFKLAYFLTNPQTKNENTNIPAYLKQDHVGDQLRNPGLSMVVM